MHGRRKSNATTGRSGAEGHRHPEQTREPDGFHWSTTMAIDPMLYEKMSGRKGDPYSRMGSALAGSDAAQAARTAEKERSYTEKRMVAKYQAYAIMSVVLLVVGAIVWVAMKVFG